MKKNIIITLVLGLSFLGFSQNKVSETILTVDNEKVSKNSFTYIYNKNNSRDSLAYSEKSLNDYMELFIKYKLKVKEAETRKMDTLSSFINEFESYRTQLKKPYLTAKGFEERLIKEAYKRSSEYVSTSHILFMVDENAAPEDTLATFNKALNVRKEILAGKDFGEMAIKHSEDPSAQDPKYTKGYKGYLGFNPAFSLVYPYEKAASSTQIGEISKPVRTRYGYHLIKVNEKQKNTGKRTVAHIMIEARDGISKEDSLSKHKLILELYDQLKAGSDWDQMALEHSVDKRTAANGGMLPAFAKLESRNLPESFENAAFEILNEGDITKPIKTSYGWHIIKLIEKEPFATFEEMKPALKKKVKSSSLFGQNRAELIKELKKDNKFKLKKSAFKKTKKYADSSLVKGEWKKPLNFNPKKTLFSINKEKYTMGDYFDYLENNQKDIKKNESPAYTMELALNKYIDDKNYEYEETHLAEKYIDYRMLVQEYRDGILLFDLMKQEVWDKASKDTAGIKTFYGQNKNNYPRNRAIKAKIYKSPKESIIIQVKDSITAGLTDSKLKQVFNKTSQLNLQIESKDYEKGESEIIDLIDDSKTEQFVKHNQNYYYIIVEEIIPAGIKPLNKCRGLVISDYQNKVEAEWIAELRKKYNVTVNEAVLKSLIK